MKGSTSGCYPQVGSKPRLESWQPRLLQGGYNVLDRAKIMGIPQSSSEMNRGSNSVGEGKCAYKLEVLLCVDEDSVCDQHGNAANEHVNKPCEIELNYFNK